MANLAAAAVGATISLLAVGLGAWMQALRERRHWVRTQRLQAATEFITTTRHLLTQYRQLGAQGMDQDARRDARSRMQLARSALHLLYDAATVELADDLAKRLHETHPNTARSQYVETDDVFTRLVVRLRTGL
jgi:hypothetical protein